MNDYFVVCGGPTRRVYAKLVGLPGPSPCPCGCPVRYRVQYLGEPAGMRCGHCGRDDRAAAWPEGEVCANA